jgi:hypothetical protein
MRPRHRPPTTSPRFRNATDGKGRVDLRRRASRSAATGATLPLKEKKEWLPVKAGASATGNQILINNRQGGRRRGRGGQRPQGMPGNAGVNRQDNRQRGNAAQLLEKYKSLARDAQLAGDRVQTEYYLQYADHYFRVLEDSRSRFEEQQAQRRPRRDDDEEVEGDEELVAENDSADDEGEEIRQRPRRDRERGRERFERGDRGDRVDRDDREARANGARRDDRDDRDEDGAEERIALGVLPPSIGAPETDAEEEVAPKPRRRAARKPRSDDGDEAAPAG